MDEKKYFEHCIKETRKKAEQLAQSELIYHTLKIGMFVFTTTLFLGGMFFQALYGKITTGVAGIYVITALSSFFGTYFLHGEKEIKKEEKLVRRILKQQETDYEKYKEPSKIKNLHVWQSHRENIANQLYHVNKEKIQKRISKEKENSTKDLFPEYVQEMYPNINSSIKALALDKTKCKVLK